MTYTRPLLKQVLDERPVGFFVLRFATAAALWAIVEHFVFDQVWESALIDGLIYGFVIAVVISLASIAVPRGHDRQDPASASDEPDR